MSNTNALSAKARIETLVDENSFVEIGAMITKRSTDFNMQEKSVPADGVITGYGLIQNNPVYIYSQDASAMNGTIGEMHAKKITHVYELAMKTGVPVIGLIDCADFFVPGCTLYKVWQRTPCFPLFCYAFSDWFQVDFQSRECISFCVAYIKHLSFDLS